MKPVAQASQPQASTTCNRREHCTYFLFTRYYWGLKWDMDICLVTRTTTTFILEYPIHSHLIEVYTFIMVTSGSINNDVTIGMQEVERLQIYGCKIWGHIPPKKGYNLTILRLIAYNEY